MHRGWTFRAERIAVDKRTCKLERSGNRKVSKSPRFTVHSYLKKQQTKNQRRENRTTTGPGRNGVTD